MATPTIIPPWLSSAPSPADSYARGVSVGAQIGHERAALQLQQEAADRASQQEAVDDEIKKAKIMLAADEAGRNAQEAAQRFAAQNEYTQLVRGGTPPAQAMLQVGTRLGLTGPGIAALAKETTPFPLNVVEQGGEKFLQTSPSSYSHIPKEKQGKPFEDYHNSDGTVSRVFQDGTVQVLGAPIARPDKTKARYTFKDDATGKTITGTTDDPEIKRLVDEATARRQKEEADKNAPSKPGFFSTLHDALFGGPTPPPQPSVYPNPNDQAAPPLTPQAAPQSPSLKVKKANELARKHPDWTKKQIIDAVNSGAE